MTQTLSILVVLDQSTDHFSISINNHSIDNRNINKTNQNTDKDNQSTRLKLF